MSDIRTRINSPGPTGGWVGQWRGVAGVKTRVVDHNYATHNVRATNEVLIQM